MNNMEQCVANVISNEIKQAIHESPFVSLLIDETVNVTFHKKLIVSFFDTSMKNGCAKTVFHWNYTVAAGDAETIYNKLVEVCENIALDPRKIVGLGSDGAWCQMVRILGKKTGVGVRLKACSPHLTHVHCITHRVNLAASGVAKLESVDRYRKTVNRVFKLFKYSAARYQQLRKLHMAMEPNDFQRLKEPCSVQWLSFTKATKSIDVNWPQLVLALGEEPARKSPTADGLLRQLKTFSFAAMTNTLLDVLPIMMCYLSWIDWISRFSKMMSIYLQSVQGSTAQSHA